MALDLSIYTVPLLVAIVLLAGVAAIAWQRRTTPGALFLLWACGLLIAYTLGYAFELSSTRESQVLFWLKVQYIGVPGLGAVVFMLTLAYTGGERYLTRRNRALLMLIPAITLLLAWTNESHELIWRDLHIERVRGFTGTHFAGGGWYWAQEAYSYTLAMLTILLLGRWYLRSTGLYRYQLGTMLFSLLVAVVAGAAFQAGLGPEGLDVMPYSFAITGLGLGLAIFYYQLFDIAPIAHDMVFGSMSDAVLVIDTAGRIVDANRAAETLLGAPRARLLGVPLDSALPAGLDPFAQFARDDRPQAELDLYTSAPQVFDVRRRPILRATGQQAGTLFVLRDVTARRRMEDERTQLIAELDSFAHTVAHDLKTPLTAVSGYAELIADDGPGLAPAALRENADIILQNSIRMNTIIDALLLLSTVRQCDVQFEPLDTAALVADVQDRLLTRIQASGAQITVPDSWPQAAGYPAWIEEVWANYLSNAIKYGGDPPVIVLGGEPLDDGAMFWVRDNGSGLDPDQQTQLFLPFTRLHKIDADGHGLGLSIVRRIVEKHGGAVGVESTPGQGSTFFFTLPGVPSE